MRSIETLQFQKWPVRIERIPHRRSIAIYLKPNQPIIVRTGLLVPVAKIIEFLNLKETWLKKNLFKFEEDKFKHPPRPLREGTLFPILGTEYRLVVTPTPNKKAFISLVVDQLKLHIPINDWDAHAKSELHEKHHRLIIQFYQKKSVEYITERLLFWSQQMKLHPRQIKFRSQKTRWGSCSSQKVINLNWRLIVFKPEIIDYVIIHELSHLSHMNHSKQFWNLVEQFLPHYEIYRKQIKEQQSRAGFFDELLS